MRSIAKLIAVAGWCALAAGACSAQPAQNNVVAVKATDPEMNAAKAKAIAELPAFFARFARPAADEGNFMVKFDIDPKGDPEFIWAGDLQQTGDQLTGVLSDDAVYAPGKAGDRVAIPRSAIIDWGYTRAGVMQGSYTTRVLLGRLSPEEAARVRESLGW